MLPNPLERLVDAGDVSRWRYMNVVGLMFIERHLQRKSKELSGQL
jgi:hypothetical protein